MTRRPSRLPRGHYDVGYGKPPVASRFRQGTSGNPKGRPRRSDSFASTVAKILGSKVSLRDATGLRKISILEAAVRKLAHAATNGDLRAIKLVMELGEAVQDYMPGAAGKTSPREILQEQLGKIRERLSGNGDGSG